MEGLSTTRFKGGGDQISNQASLLLSTMGCRAWLAEASGIFDLGHQRRIWALAAALKSDQRVENVILGVTNVLVILRQIPQDETAITDWLMQQWQLAKAIPIAGREIVIPVTYGGEWATDLDAVCRHTGLSAREVVQRHYRGRYTVCAVGSAPGFGYLHGLDPALATPRKTVPSLNMLKGTVTIGGPQTGISVLTGPNGWNAIGFAEGEFFDPHRTPPALMAPGDTLRFVPEKIEL